MSVLLWRFLIGCFIFDLLCVFIPICYLGLLFLFENSLKKYMALKNLKLFQPAHSFLDHLFCLNARPLFLFLLFWDFNLLSSPSVWFWILWFEFPDQLLLEYASISCVKALAFQSPIPVKTETPSVNKISP